MVSTALYRLTALFISFQKEGAYTAKYQNASITSFRQCLLLLQSRRHGFNIDNFRKQIYHLRKHVVFQKRVWRTKLFQAPYRNLKRNKTIQPRQIVLYWNIWSNVFLHILWRLFLYLRSNQPWVATDTYNRNRNIPYWKTKQISVVLLPPHF